MWKSWWYNRLCRQRSAVEADLEDTGEPMDGGSQKPGTGKDLGNTELMGQDGRSSERSDRRSLTAGRNAQSSQPSAAKFFTACLLFQGKCRKKQGNKAKCCRDEVPLMNIFQCPHDRDTVLVCPEPCIQDVQVKLAPVVDNQEEKGPHHCVVPSPPCSYGQVKQWHISQLHEQDMVLHIEIWDFGRDCGPPYYIAIWELTEGSRQVAWRTWIPRTLFEDSSKRKELEAFKAELDSEQEQKTLDTEQAQQIKLKERQKFFEEAFQQDMEQYLSAGYLQITERREPIGSMSSMEVNVDMLEQMDLMDMSDQEALDVFLNSGGEDNSAASPMLGQEPEPFPPTEITLQVPTQAELRHKLSSPSSSCKDSGSQAAGECPAAQRDGAPPERGVAVQPDDSNSRAT